MYTKQLKTIDSRDTQQALKKLLAQLNTVQLESERVLESLQKSVEDLQKRVSALEQS